MTASEDYRRTGKPRQVGSALSKRIHALNPAFWIYLPLLVLVLCAVTKPGGRPFGFADAKVYAGAIEAQLTGGDPYAHRPFMNFLYPPAIVLSGAELARLFSLPFLRSAYIALHLTAALALPWILYRYYLSVPRSSSSAFYLLFFLAPGLLGISALDAGNIALICYTAALGAAVPGLKQNRWLAFYAVVFCCAAVKITFLPLLLLPLFCGAGQVRAVVICGGGAIAGLAAQAYLLPDYYLRFRDIVSRQSLEIGDDGKGLFGIAFHLLRNTKDRSLVVPMLVYAVGAVCVIAALVTLRRRSLQDRCSYWPALVVVAVLFVIPRINDYDLCVGFPLAFCIAAREMKRAKLVFLYSALWIPSLLLAILYKQSVMNGGLEALAMLGMFAVAISQLLGPSPQRQGSLAAAPSPAVLAVTTDSL